MPLPRLNPTNLEVDTDLLPLSLNDYLDPSINRNFWKPTRGSAFSTNLLTIKQIIDLCKTFSATPEIYNEIVPSLTQYWCGSQNESCKRIMKAIHGILPEEHRWLACCISVTNFRDRSPNTRSCEINFSYPDTIAYHETYTRLWITKTLNVTRDESNNWTPTDSQIQAFLELITADETLQAVTGKFTRHSEQSLNYHDVMVPTILRMILKYTWDQPIFYPRDDYSQYGLSHDFHRPSKIVEALATGIKLKYEHRSNWDRINFTLRPSPGDRRAISRVLQYSANVLDYIPYTIKGEKETAAPLYGVELEMSSDYTAQQLIDAQKDLFFILKADGSVYGDRSNAFELVTVPCSLKGHKRLWAEFFEKIDYQLFDTSKNTGNGMHVHIGRNLFTTNHLNRFTWFITNPGNEDFILAISERPTKQNFNEWAARPNHFRLQSKIKAARSAMNLNSGIRGAVHFKGDKTVEVRIFKGIVSYATIVKNLEFVDSVFEYTRVTMLSQLGLRNYMNWLKATPKNKYQMLKAFIAEIKSEDMVASSEVTDYIWNLNRDHEVAEKLNKAPFKITNSHITALNKKKRKRIFKLKNGIVEVAVASGGLLAKFDKTVQQKQTRGAATFAMTEFAA